jgi:hypothetical protein
MNLKNDTNKTRNEEEIYYESGPMVNITEKYNESKSNEVSKE